MAPVKSGKKKGKPSLKAVAGSRTVPESRPRDRMMAAAVCVVLVLACIAIYGQTLSHQFVNYDDELYVTGNPQVQAGLNMRSIRWAFVSETAAYFHPLTWLSHTLDCSLYGLNPWGHHLTNLVFHTAASVLLFLALRLLTGALWPSAAVAALFAVHPLHVESVAWVAERKDVLSAFFWMLSLGAYGFYARRRGVVRYTAVAAAFVLGLMSKPMMVTLPCVLLLLDYWPLDRLDRDEPFGTMARKSLPLAVEKIPLFLLALLSGVSTMVMQARGDNLAFGDRVPFAARCANAIVVYVLYLVKTVWPSGLTAFYPHPITRPVWQVAGAALILAAITVFCLRHARRRPYLIVGWLWYLGVLVPVIELVQAGNFSHADRYTYLPSIGVFIMVAWGAADLAAAWKVPKRALAAASGIVLVAFTVCAYFQTGYWRDSKTLFNHALAAGWESGLAYNNLGLVAKDEKDYDKARTCFEKALALEPGYTNALNNMGLLSMKGKRYDEARAYLKKAVELDPKYTGALNNLGWCLMNQGQNEEAQIYLRRALDIDPQFVTAMYNLGNALASLGRQEEADGYFRKAAELDPAQGMAKKQ